MGCKEYDINKVGKKMIFRTQHNGPIDEAYKNNSRIWNNIVLELQCRGSSSRIMFSVPNRAALIRGLQWVTKERNSLKLLLGQKGEEIKDLQSELAWAHLDQIDLSEQVIILLKAYGLDTGTMANFSVSQLQQKIEMIGKLREDVNVIRAESLKWKEGIDRFAAEKETARAQLSSAENQLQKMKEKSLVQAGRIEELEHRLASELAKVESDAEKAKADADALVAVYRANAKAAQRETLEEIHARGFDLAEEIKRAKELEVDNEALVSDDDDDENDDDDGSKSGWGAR
ncbi:uncharacterized protein [Nicotiana tomentosiformis]|uniref:uncharacterized protein n=1 Tax=Nicotiana tomentosiformis TaxID=4098 RepID=UPI00388C3BC5